MLVWDVTCVDTLAKSYISGSQKEARSAANSAERRKHSKYSSLPQQYWFSPLGFETLGCWGSDAYQLIRDIGRRMARATQEPRSLEFLRQRVAVEIQRGNAICLRSTLPSPASFHEVFLI